MAMRFLSISLDSASSGTSASIPIFQMYIRVQNNYRQTCADRSYANGYKTAVDATIVNIGWMSTRRHDFRVILQPSAYLERCVLEG